MTNFLKAKLQECLAALTEKHYSSQVRLRFIVVWTYLSRLHMKFRCFTFLCMVVPTIMAHAQSTTFSRFTEDLPQLLETDAATVMVRGLTHDFANKLCARLGGSLAQEVEKEVTEWRARNDNFIKGAAKAINEIGNQYIPNGGEQAKQSYFQMILRETATIANQRLMRQLNGANLDNKITPPEAACSGLANLLRDGKGDFQNTPEITRALVPYMQGRKPHIVGHQ